MPEKSNAEAAAMFARMIEDSLRSWFTQFNFFLHNLAQLRFHGDHNDDQLLTFVPKTFTQATDGRIIEVFTSRITAVPMFCNTPIVDLSCAVSSGESGGISEALRPRKVLRLCGQRAAREAERSQLSVPIVSRVWRAPPEALSQVSADFQPAAQSVQGRTLGPQLGQSCGRKTALRTRPLSRLLVQNGRRNRTRRSIYTQFLNFLN